MSKTFFSWNEEVLIVIERLVKAKKLKGMEIYLASKLLEYVLYRTKHNSKASLNYIKEGFPSHCSGAVDKIYVILKGTAVLKGEEKDIVIDLNAPVGAPVKNPLKKKEIKIKEGKIKDIKNKEAPWDTSDSNILSVTQMIAQSDKEYLESEEFKEFDSKCKQMYGNPF